MARVFVNVNFLTAQHKITGGQTVQQRMRKRSAVFQEETTAMEHDCQAIFHSVKIRFRRYVVCFIAVMFAFFVVPCTSLGGTLFPITLESFQQLSKIDSLKYPHDDVFKRDP